MGLSNLTKYGKTFVLEFTKSNTLPDGYYWIKLRNDHWFIGELLAGDWYVCGMERCLSHQPIEIGQRIERI